MGTGVPVYGFGFGRDRKVKAFPRGEGAPVRTLGRMRNAGGNVRFVHLYRLFLNAVLPPFLTRLKIRPLRTKFNPPSPRGRVLRLRLPRNDMRVRNGCCRGRCLHFPTVIFGRMWASAPTWLFAIRFLLSQMLIE